MKTNDLIHEKCPARPLHATGNDISKHPQHVKLYQIRWRTVVFHYKNITSYVFFHVFFRLKFRTCRGRAEPDVRICENFHSQQ